MQSSRIQRAFLFGLLSFSCILVPPSSARSSVKVKLHDSATLSCSERCSGLVRWTASRKPTDVLSECDQTSCRSVKEGYQMIHDQYLKGNLSLTITDADFTKRTWYTCQCDGKDVCDVSLRLEPPENFLQMNRGDNLTLDLPVSEPVKVTFNRTGDSDPNPVKLCEVKGRKVQCDPPYEERVLFQSSLQLKDLKDSDGGVYAVVDTENEEVVSTYRTTVRGEKESWVWKIWEKTEFGIGLGVGVFLGALLGFFVPPQIVRGWMWLKRRTQRSHGHCTTAEDKSQSTTTEQVPLKEKPSG
ncbi:uncharacterized protein LOC118826858 isoform X1 [Colossoma macropomum]|uniref:uncharacterized protein LOC118826858 isoform X1 n=2 Tax=Colossoma macropomum TaxID=42526 RepID=UPI001863B913|nr:uncharacterized protein LOC118826858 isoform X1 [Colossoma macropomum]